MSKSSRRGSGGSKSRSRSEEPFLAPDSMVDHFRVVRLVGRGGMGEVYLARDTLLNRRVALKVVHPRYLDSEEAATRFVREAQLTASLSHPHIVTVYAVGRHEGRPYLALEYLEGQNLRQRMDEQRPGVRESLRIVLAIAQALVEAHRNRVLHRDLKPENVILAKDGRLRLVDLGLAKVTASSLSGHWGHSVELERILERHERRSVPGAPPAVDETVVAAAKGKGGESALGADPLPGNPLIEHEHEHEHEHELSSRRPAKWSVPAPVSTSAVHPTPAAKRVVERAVEPAVERATVAADGETPELACHAGAGGVRTVEETTGWIAGQAEVASGHASGHATELGTVQGTPAYMAPEQWRGEASSETTDVWALGVILHELLVGRRPFRDDRTEALREAVLQGTAVPPLAAASQDVPAELAALVGRCLEKDAGERPSAIQVVDALERLLWEGRRQVGAEQSPFRGLFPFAERHADLFFGRDSEIVVFLESLREQAVLPVVGPSGAGKSSFVQAGVVPRLREQGAWITLSIRPGADPFGVLAARLTSGESNTRVSMVSESSVRTADFSHLREMADAGAAAAAGAAGAAAAVASVLPAQPALPESPSSESPESPESAACRDEELLAHRLLQAPESLGVILHDVAERERCRVLLLVDQLEEVYTMVADATVRDAFVRAVCGVADHPSSPVRAVFTIRDDFLGHLEGGPEVAAALARVFVLRRPGKEGLEEVLTRPLTTVGYAYDDPLLPAEMVESVRDEPACLPLLQFACQMLWDRRNKSRRLLCRAAYSAMGGVAGSLAEHADGVLAGMTPSQVELVRQLMLRLVTSAGMRRVVPVATAVAGLGPGIEEVLEKLTQARLLTVRRSAAETSRRQHGDGKDIGDDGTGAGKWGRRSRSGKSGRGGHDSAGSATGSAIGESRRIGDGAGAGGSGGEAVLELVHESLVRTWGRLARWIEECREELAVLAEIGQAAELWQQRGRRDEEVWQGDALADARRKLARLTTQVPEHVALFVQASLRKEQRLLRRKRLLQSSAVAILATVALVSLVIAKRMDEQRRASEVQRARAEKREAEAQREGAKAAMLRGDLLEARAKLRGSLEIQDSLLGRVLWWRLERDPLFWQKELGAAVPAVVFSPDGKTVAAAANARIVYLLDVDTQEVRFLRVQGGDLSSVAFSPDGRQLAAGAVTGAVTLFDLAKKTAVSLDGHTNVVWSVAFSPDGRQLASGSEDRSVRLWDTSTGKHSRMLAVQTGAVRAVTYHPDGSWLASTDSARVHLWHVGTWSKKKTLSVEVHQAYCLAFSPDGKWLASASSGGSIRQWDVATGTLQTVLLGHKQGVLGLAISNDSRTIVSGGIDKTIRVWDVASGREQYALLGHHDTVHSIALSPDGTLLASGSNDKSVRLWRMATRPTVRAVGHDGAVQAVAVSPDGRFLATAGIDRTVRLWDAVSGSQLLAHAGFAGGARSVALSPDGRLLAAGSADRSIRVWSLFSAAEPRVFSGHQGVAGGVAFSPDGKTMVTAGSDMTVRMWDVATGKEKQVLVGHAAPVASVAISPDGTRLASCSYDRTIRLWDARTGAQQQVLTGHDDLVLDVAFNRDGKQLASASCDRTVRLWNLAAGGGAARILGEHPGNVYSVAFHPDDRHLGSSSVDGTARIWDIVTGKHVSLAGHRRDVMAIRFSLDGKQAATASEDGTVRLWDTETAAPLWRAPVLLGSLPGAGIATPEAFTHSGWAELGAVATPALASGGSRSSDSAVEWRRAVEHLAVSGQVAAPIAAAGVAAKPAPAAPRTAGAVGDGASSGLLCLRTRDDHLQAWDMVADRVLFDRSVPGIEKIVAVSPGCAVTANGRARLYSVDGRTSVELGANRAPATALAAAGFPADAAATESSSRGGGGGILVAAGSEVLVFDVHGAQVGELVADVGQTAVGWAGGHIVVGFDDGNL
ncbi:MAG: protein kinase [Pseudomonadota bacterium]